MRKRIISQDTPKSPVNQPEWLDLAALAQVEVSSEDPSHPIESALIPGSTSGWRAFVVGKQTIRVIFDTPQTIKRLYLQFREHSGRDRTQEFVLRSTSGVGKPSRDIVRQQYNFSALDSKEEVEDYAVDLAGVTSLELIIIPNISGGDIRASLEQLRVA